uniref:Uncharacterized protein n=1 Tax=Glossina palpalis gambiensis TaxID=67801 RepID=A0A1B0C4H5_9MUSC
MQSIGPMVDHKLSKEINVYQKYRSGDALKCPHQRKRNVLQKLLPLPYRTFKRIDCSHNLLPQVASFKVSQIYRIY